VKAKNLKEVSLGWAEHDEKRNKMKKIIEIYP
jgi:hypothetical protein